MPESQEKSMYIRSIVRIMDAELEKDADKIDTALLAECDEWLKWLESDGQELSDGELVQKYERLMRRINSSVDVQNDTHCRKSRSGKLKKAFVAAIAAALTLISLTVVCVAVPSVRDRIAEIVRMPNHSVIEQDNITYIKGDINKTCSSLDECLKERNLDILYPHNLPDSVRVNYVLDFRDSKEGVMLEIIWSNGMTLALQHSDQQLSNSDAVLYEVNGRRFLTMTITNQNTGESEHLAYLYTNEYCYTLSAKTEEDLSVMMDKME